MCLGRASSHNEVQAAASVSEKGHSLITCDVNTIEG